MMFAAMKQYRKVNSFVKQMYRVLEKVFEASGYCSRY